MFLMVVRQNFYILAHFLFVGVFLNGADTLGLICRDEEEKGYW